MRVGITIVGLGPGNSDDWTRAAYQALSQAAEVYLRTGHHPSIHDIPGRTRTFDDWYEQHDDFDVVDRRVAAEIVRLGRRDEGVIYAVPGHPNVGEATVQHILTQANAQALPVSIVPGLSFIEPALTALNIAGPENLQLAYAGQLAARYHPPLEQDRPALIPYLYGRPMAAQVKRTLLNAYPDDFVVALVQAAGTVQEQVWRCRLSELDQQPQLDEPTMLYLAADTGQSSFSTFQETIAHLRSPDGCPWDQKQTHQSLRPYLLEETYEVLETLDTNDTAALAEELGDLLLQIMLHTQIAVDQGEFKMGVVVEHINSKMLRRHPHVFGDVVIQGLEDLTTNWEAIKRKEKAAKGQAAPASAMDGVPTTLPALAQALAVSRQAVRKGFEWDNIEGVLEKIIEEAREVAEATDPAHIEAEIGDLIFCVVNLARWRQVDPESALRATNARFSRRFRKMEQLAADQGKDLSSLPLAEMDVLWAEAKKQLAE